MVQVVTTLQNGNYIDDSHFRGKGILRCSAPVVRTSRKGICSLGRRRSSACMVCILGSFHVRTLGNRNLGSARSSSHPLPQRLQHSQGILPILEVQVDFVGTAAPQPNNRRSVLRLVSVYAHKVSLTVFIVDNSLHFVKNFSRFVLKWLATHVYNSLQNGISSSLRIASFAAFSFRTSKR